MSISELLGFFNKNSNKQDPSSEDFDNDEEDNNSIKFARFMQSYSARKFTRKFGFPEKIGSVYIHKSDALKSQKLFLFSTRGNYWWPASNLEEKRSINFYDLEHEGIIETNEGEVITGSHIDSFFRKGFSDDLISLLRGVVKETPLYLYEELVSSKHFEEMIETFPVFDDKGNCIYFMDLNKGDLYIPREYERKLNKIENFGIVPSEEYGC